MTLPKRIHVIITLLKGQNVPRFLYPALCFTAGSFMALGMTPYNIWGVVPIGFSILYLALNAAKRPLHAALYSYVFAFGFFLFSLSWIASALLIEGNPYQWVWGLAIFGMPFMLSPFWAFGGWFIKKNFNLKTINGYIGFCVSLAVTEYLRGHLFTGFPWNLPGYAWAGTPEMLQSLSWIGIYGLSALTIFWASFPAYAFIARSPRTIKLRMGTIIIFTLAFCFGYGVRALNKDNPQQHPQIRIDLNHPQIAQKDKWNPEKSADNFILHVQSLFKNMPSATPEDTTYIIWPETALSFEQTENPAAMAMIRDSLQSYPGQAYIITGLLRRGAQKGEYYNSLATIDKNGNITDIYDKSHLVPFGEYIPFQDFIPLKTITQFSGFMRGEGRTSLSLPENSRILYSPLICYEAIFPNGVTPRSTPPVDMMINVTNDAWYEGTNGPEQHLQHARMRTIEEGIPLVRAANGGISAVISPNGEILSTSDISSLIYALPHPQRQHNIQKKVREIAIHAMLLLMLLLAYCNKRNAVS